MAIVGNAGSFALVKLNWKELASIQLLGFAPDPSREAGLWVASATPPYKAAVEIRGRCGVAKLDHPLIKVSSKVYMLKT